VVAGRRLGGLRRVALVITGRRGRLVGLWLLVVVAGWRRRLGLAWRRIMCWCLRSSKWVLLIGVAGGRRCVKKLSWGFLEEALVLGIGIPTEDVLRFAAPTLDFEEQGGGGPCVAVKNADCQARELLPWVARWDDRLDDAVLLPPSVE
jgi:hypothetical protein